MQMLSRMQTLGLQSGEDIQLMLTRVALPHFLHTLGYGSDATLGSTLEERQALLGQGLRSLLLHGCTHPRRAETLVGHSHAPKGSRGCTS